MSGEKNSTNSDCLSAKECALVFRKLKADPSNRVCFDCNYKNPNWTSIPFGVYLCMNCSAAHRRMGTHITFVRSSILDKWTKDQIVQMIAGGNARAREFFKGRGWASTSNDRQKEKYTSRAARLYRTHLEKEAAKAHFQLQQLLHVPKPEAKPRPSALHMDTNTGLDNLLSEIRQSPTSGSGGSAGGRANSLATTGAGLRQHSATPTPTTHGLVAKGHVVGVKSLNGANKAAAAASAAAAAGGSSQSAASSASTVVAKKVEQESGLKVKEKSPRRVVVRTHHKLNQHEKNAKSPPLRAVAIGTTRRKKKKSSSLLSTRKTKRSTTATVTSVGTSRSSGSWSASQDDDLDKVMKGLVLDRDVADAAAKAAAEEQAKKNDAERKRQIEAARKREQQQQQQQQQQNGSGQRFSSSKGISSDQYFNRGAFAPATAEDKQRLSSFSSARAISSDQFFDREQDGDEDEDGVDLAQITNQLSGMANSLLSSFQHN